jgi:uncharacterized protein
LKQPYHTVERCFTIQHRDLTLAYFPQKGQVLSVNAAACSILEQLSSGSGFIPNSATERHFVRTLDHLELLVNPITGIHSITATEAHTGEYLPARAALLLTSACNLSCIYCYSRRDGIPAVTMPRAMAMAAVDLIVDNAAKTGVTAQLQFHGGGEPSNAWSLLRDTIEYFEAKTKAAGLGGFIGITTNGVIPVGRLAWLAEHVHEFCISWDGPREIHERLRPKNNHQSSYDDVIRTFDYLDRRDKSYWVLTTVLSESLEHLSEIIPLLAGRPGCQAVYLEPFYQQGKGRYLNPVEASEFIDAFRPLRQVGNLKGLRIEYSSARVGCLSRRYCYATEPAFTVTPTGVVTACYMVTELEDNNSGFFFHGQFDPVSNQYVFDPEAGNRLQSRNADSLSACRDCFCRYQCAGGCLNQAGSLSQVSDYRCQITRALTLDQLVESLG